MCLSENTAINTSIKRLAALKGEIKVWIFILRVKLSHDKYLQKVCYRRPVVHLQTEAWCLTDMLWSSKSRVGKLNLLQLLILQGYYFRAHLTFSNCPLDSQVMGYFCSGFSCVSQPCFQLYITATQWPISRDIREPITTMMLL